MIVAQPDESDNGRINVAGPGAGWTAHTTAPGRGNRTKTGGNYRNAMV